MIVNKKQLFIYTLNIWRGKTLQKLTTTACIQASVYRQQTFYNIKCQPALKISCNIENDSVYLYCTKTQIILSPMTLIVLHMRCMKWSKTKFV